jgi:hypothetical protein
MSIKNLTIHFYAKIILLLVVIPYAVYFVFAIQSADFLTSSIEVIICIALEFIIYIMASKEYKKAAGFKSKYKPQNKDKKKS